MLSPQPNRWVVLLVVMLAFLPIVLDLTILHVAIPSLTLALEATGTEVLWIIDIYPLLMASLLIPMGTLADRIGHRRLLFIGLSVFGVGSALAAMSPTAQALIGARALMAVGAAMVMPCTLAIIRQTFKDDTERATAPGSGGCGISRCRTGAARRRRTTGALLVGLGLLVNVPVLMLAIPLVFFRATSCRARRRRPEASAGIAPDGGADGHGVRHQNGTQE